MPTDFHSSLAASIVKYAQYCRELNRNFDAIQNDPSLMWGICEAQFPGLLRHPMNDPNRSALIADSILLRYHKTHGHTLLHNDAFWSNGLRPLLYSLIFAGQAIGYAMYSMPRKVATLTRADVDGKWEMFFKVEQVLPPVVEGLVECDPIVWAASTQQATQFYIAIGSESERAEMQALTMCYRSVAMSFLITAYPLGLPP